MFATGIECSYPMIRDRTRLSRLFGTYIGILMRRMAAASLPQPGA